MDAGHATGRPPRLVAPDALRLGAYAEALVRGWSPDGVPGGRRAVRELAAIREEPLEFLRSAGGSPASGILSMWVWDGEFCGVVEIARGPDAAVRAVPVLVPWKRGRGYSDAVREALADRSGRTG